MHCIGVDEGVRESTVTVESLTPLFMLSSASGKRMGENRARTDFHSSLSTEGMPVYEQKKLRMQRGVPKARFCEWAWAERNFFRKAWEAGSNPLRLL